MASSSSGGESAGGPPAPPTVPDTTARADSAAGPNIDPSPPDIGQSPIRLGLAGLARVGRQIVAGISPQHPRNNTVASTPANAAITTNTSGTPQASNRSNRSNRPADGAQPSSVNEAEAPVLDTTQQDTWVCQKCGAGPWPIQTRKRCSCYAWQPGARKGNKRRTKQQIEQDLASSSRPSPPAAAAASSGGPVVVLVPPGLARQSADLSPMTANAADDDDATFSSIDTAGNVDTAAVAGLARADLTEKGDGGDSDEEGDGYYLQNDMQEHANNTDIEKRTSDYNEIEETVLASEENGLECLAGNYDPCSLPGAPAGWKAPAPPEGWTHEPRTDWGEPIAPDNPGNWSPYCFTAKFSGAGANRRYVKHSMPAGAIPAPANEETGKRMAGDWEMHYNGWKQTSPDPSFSREGATRGSLFPKSRLGKLDASLLEKMGLTKERMVNGDILFFLQLILPICDPKKSGIDDDPRKSYFIDCCKHTNKYAHDVKDRDGMYNNEFRSVNP